MEAPAHLIGRDREWRAVREFVHGGVGIALVYGPRRAGTSALLSAVAASLGGRVHRCASGTRHVQLRRFSEFLDQEFTSEPRPLESWSAALDRVRRLNVPVVVIDDVPEALATSPDLPDALGRYADARNGPTIVLAGSSQPAMLSLLAHGSPLFGKVSLAVTPSTLSSPDVARLWNVDRPMSALWVDAVVGGLPGYRPLLSPPGEKLSTWMRGEVLAGRSAVLDAADASLGDLLIGVEPGLGRSVLDAVAWGSSTPDALAFDVGADIDAVSGALHHLERNGAVTRVRDVLRERRDSYDITDPHLRFWLAVVAPNRDALMAGRASDVWASVRDNVWRTRVLRRRWEEVVRRHVAVTGVGPWAVGPVAVVGRSAGLDLVATDATRRVIAIGRTSLEALGVDDVAMLSKRRDDLGLDDDVSLVLASTVRVDAAAVKAGAVAVTPAEVYGHHG